LALTNIEITYRRKVPRNKLKNYVEENDT